MGCGLAYYSGKGCGNGARLAPYWFGPRPNPVRPAVIPPTFSAHNVKVRYPPFVYNEPIRSTATQFYRNPGNGPSPQYAQPHHFALPDRQLPQRLANPFEYSVQQNKPCSCAALYL